MNQMMKVEKILALLYTDVNFRQSFLINIDDALIPFDLTREEIREFRKIDIIGVFMTANSITAKKKLFSKKKL